MTGKEAYEALREGKPIRRKGWAKAERFYLNLEQNCVFFKSADSEPDQVGWLEVGCYLFGGYHSDEWELYEEEIPEPIIEPFETAWAFLYEAPEATVIFPKGKREKSTLVVSRDKCIPDVVFEISEDGEDLKSIRIGMEDACEIAQKILTTRTGAPHAVATLADLSKSVDESISSVKSIRSRVGDLEELLDWCRASLNGVERTFGLAARKE
jgi:hypothetical protein